MLAIEGLVMTEPESDHLEPGLVAAYIAHTSDDDAIRLVEGHLASCRECRDEVAEARRIVADLPGRRVAARWIPIAAAAAIVLLVLLPPGQLRVGQHRESPVTTTIAPAAVGPVGSVEPSPTFRWTSVPYADAYEVRVYAADGSIQWEQRTRDTTAAIPASAGLRPEVPYYWKVEALTGFDRRAASELTEFSIRKGR